MPGDNDIGGEMEPVYRHLLERFERQFPPYFHRMDALNFIKIFKVIYNTLLGNHNIYFQTNPMRYGTFDGVYGKNGGQVMDSNEKEISIRLLLSHIPIIKQMSSRLEQELQRINIVLSGHDHTVKN